MGRRGGAEAVGGRWMPPERAYKPDRHGAVVAGPDWDAFGVWRGRGATLWRVRFLKWVSDFMVFPFFLIV